MPLAPSLLAARGSGGGGGGGGTSASARSVSKSHADPFSTPSRRRRVYLQVAQASYVLYKKEAIRRAMRHRVETAACLILQPVIRRWLAHRLFRLLVALRRA